MSQQAPQQQQQQPQYSTYPSQNGQPQQYNQQQSLAAPPQNISNDDLLMYIVCFFCPPLAIFWLKGGCEQEVIITAILWCLFWFPGFLYALYLIFQKQKMIQQEKGPQSQMV